MRRQSVKHGVCKNDGDGELEELKENPGGKVSSLNLQKSGHRRENNEDESKGVELFDEHSLAVLKSICQRRQAGDSRGDILGVSNTRGNIAPGEGVIYESLDEKGEDEEQRRNHR